MPKMSKKGDRDEREEMEELNKAFSFLKDAMNEADVMANQFIQLINKRNPDSIAAYIAAKRLLIELRRADSELEGIDDFVDVFIHRLDQITHKNENKKKSDC